MNTLTPRQLRAVEAIAASDSISAAADECGVHRATLHRWLALPDFAEALDDIQADQRARAVRRLSGALDRAAAIVIDLADHAEDDAIRLRAAIAIPQMLREVLELSASTIVIDAPAHPVTVFNHDAVVRSLAVTSEAAAACR